MSSSEEPLLPAQRDPSPTAVADPTLLGPSPDSERRVSRICLYALAIAGTLELTVSGFDHTGTAAALLLILLHFLHVDRDFSAAAGGSAANGLYLLPALLTGGRSLYLPPLPARNASTADAAAAAAWAASEHIPQNTLGHDLAWLQARAAGMAAYWGFGSGLSFAQLAADGDSVDDVIKGGDGAAYSKAVVVAFLSGPPPVRRNESQLYMSVAATDGLADVIPAPAINAAAAALEARLGRRLFPISVETARFRKPGGAALPPYAAFDVSSGRIILDSRVVRQMHSMRAVLRDGLAAFADALFSQLARAAGAAGVTGQGNLATVAEAVLRAAVAAIGVAAAYQVPLWFCVACPAVLGLLAPLVINSALGALADAACQRWALPSEECNDLWYGAFAAGMVLSLASAVPIVFICRLPECAHRRQQQ